MSDQIVEGRHEKHEHLAAFLTALEGGAIDPNILHAMMYLTYLQEEGVGPGPGCGYNFTFDPPIDMSKWGTMVKFNFQFYDGGDEPQGMVVLLDHVKDDLEQLDGFGEYFDLLCEERKSKASSVWSRYSNRFHGREEPNEAMDIIERAAAIIKRDERYAEQDTKAA